MLSDARRRERGLAIILVAGGLVVLMVFAAFAIDLGLVYNARRQDQSAVDAAALGGAQELSTTPDALISQVEDLAHQSLGLAPGTLDFDSCAGDANALANVVTASDGSTRNCMTREGRLLRVQLPLQQADAYFGVVIGRDSYDHDAFAIAGLTREGYGNVLPFALFTSDVGHVCLRTDNPSSPLSPCAGTETGDSGLLDLTQFGDPTLGTSANCPGQGAGPAGRLANNVAVGVDHDLDLRPSAAAVIRDDHEKCVDQNAYSGDPNGTETNRTAGASQGLATGLFSGTSFSDGGPARLQREALVSYDQRATVEGNDVDSTPLWAFIGEAIDTTEIPNQCERAQFEAVRAGDLSGLPLTVQNRLSTFSSIETRMQKMLERCFDLYLTGTWDDDGAIANPETRSGCTPSPPSPCTGVLFGRNTVVSDPEIYDIQLTPRFAYVPWVWEEGPGPNYVTYRRFVPMFIQLLCIGNAQCNQGTFSPGVPWVDGGNATNDNVAAVTAFTFTESMLPGELGSEDAPHDINVNVFLRLVR